MVVRSGWKDRGDLVVDDRNFQLCGDGHVVSAELHRPIPNVV
jgi:hypothetical protein